MIHPLASKKASGWFLSSFSAILRVCLPYSLLKMRKKKIMNIAIAPATFQGQYSESLIQVVIPIFNMLAPAMIHMIPAVMISVCLLTW